MTQAKKDDGTSEALTVEKAATVFESLLSEAEKKQPRETPPVDEKPEAKAAEIPAPDAEETEQTEQPVPDAKSDETDQPDPEPRKWRVKVDGVEQEVTEDELIHGYSRTADYTRKTQALAREKEAFAEHEAAVRAERQRYARNLAQLEEAIKAFTPDEPDWDALRQQDPQKFAETWAAWDQHKKKVDAVTAERKAAQERVEADNRKAIAETIESEKQKLVEAIPAWKDPAVMKTEAEELRAYAKSLGYTDEMLNAVTDHRAILVLRHSMLYDKANKNKPVVQQKLERVKTATPGPAARTARPAADVGAKARQRLARTGRIEDAAAALREMID